jgi:hypothetical protein
MAAVFAAAAFGYGGRALILEIPNVFRNAPHSAFPAPFKTQVETVVSRLPRGETLLHLSTSAESWYSRMWQRALYPDHAVVYAAPEKLDAAQLRELRHRLDSRFALAVGYPLPAEGVLWSVPLPPLPGLSEESWFAELAP